MEDKCVYKTLTLKYFNISDTPQNMLFAVRRGKLFRSAPYMQNIVFSGHYHSLSVNELISCNAKPLTMCA